VATILEEPPASGRGTRRVPSAAADADVRRTGVPGLRSGMLALGVGVLAAVLLLSGALQTEFPLFAEASAARGRDCATVASARHALDAALEARLPLGAVDADDVRAVRSAIAAFDARTADLATGSVADGLVDVQQGLTELAQRVQAASVPGSSPKAAAAVEEAMATVRHAWKGSIARVCA
jgi:hypothetical protein